MKIKVKCELIVEFEWGSDDTSAEEIDFIQFMVEENSCPGTGRVGAAIENCIEKHEAASTCWGCALRGENKLLEIDGRKYVPGGVDSKGEYTPPSLEENHPPGSVDRN